MPTRLRAFTAERGRAKPGLHEEEPLIRGGAAFGYHAKMGCYPDLSNHLLARRTRMRVKYWVLILAAVAFVSATGISVVQNVRHKSEHIRLTAALKGLPLERFTAAAHKFSRERGANHSAVLLCDLVSGGYLSVVDAEHFEGAKVMVYPNADERDPQMFLVEAQARDGFVYALLADGSIQGFSPQRLEELRKSTGQRGGPANGSQPIRSETNATSSAAGSRR